MDKYVEIRNLATNWLSHVKGYDRLSVLDAIRNALYDYRNGYLSVDDPKLVSTDDEIMAALEHYFYARYQVASGEYSRLNMEMMIHGYQLAKKMNIDVRHNKDNPATRPSDIQKQWALLGATQGEEDRLWINRNMKSGGKKIEPPAFRMPPNFTGKYGNIQLNKYSY